MHGPGALLAPAVPVVTLAGVITSSFAWYAIDVTGSTRVTLLPNTTYWFAILPPAATVVLTPASPVNGVILGVS